MAELLSLGEWFADFARFGVRFWDWVFPEVGKFSTRGWIDLNRLSQSTARNLWPDENPLDKTMSFEQLMGDVSVCEIMPVAKVIGVARDNQIYRPGHIPPLFFYAPQPAYIDQYRQLLARAISDAASLKEPARKEAFAMEPGLILIVGTMESVFREKSIVNCARVASELAAALGSRL